MSCDSPPRSLPPPYQLEVDALDLSRTEAQFPQYRPSPNNSFRLDLSTSRDSCDDLANV